MEEHFLNIYFLNYEVGVSNNTPGLDWDRWYELGPYITQKIHVKTFLMRGQKSELSKTWFLSCSNLDFKLLKLGHFLMNFRFWLLGVELRKGMSISSLDFLQGYELY